MRQTNEIKCEDDVVLPHSYVMLRDLSAALLGICYVLAGNVTVLSMLSIVVKFKLP